VGGPRNLGLSHSFDTAQRGFSVSARPSPSPPPSKSLAFSIIDYILIPKMTTDIFKGFRIPVSMWRMYSAYNPLQLHPGKWGPDFVFSQTMSADENTRRANHTAIQ
jgi:hypothetical protein